MKQWTEYAAIWTILKLLGALPRATARRFAASIARVLFALLPRLRRVAEGNLRIAFPDWDDWQHQNVVRGMVRNLAWMAAEFAHFPEYTSQNISDVLVLDGHDNFLEGHRRGKGVLYLTGHIRAGGVFSFSHALFGYPLHYIAPPHAE